MNSDDLNLNGKGQQSEPAGEQVEALASGIVERAKRFERVVLKRDLIETAAAILVAGAFGSMLIFATELPWLARLGMGIAAVGAIQVMVVMNWTRRVGTASDGLPMPEFCSVKLARVDRQIRLLRNINWWYSGPVLLGCCVTFYGLLNALPDLPIWARCVEVAIYAAFLILGWGVYRLNQEAVRTELMPLRDELTTVCQVARQ